MAPRARILAARRLGRSSPSRVVVGVAPVETTFLTVVALPLDRGRHRLVTAFPGRPLPPPPPAPGDAYRTDEAFVWAQDLFEERPFATTYARLLDGRWARDAGAVPQAAFGRSDDTPRQIGAIT